MSLPSEVFSALPPEVKAYISNLERQVARPKDWRAETAVAIDKSKRHADPEFIREALNSVREVGAKQEFLMSPDIGDHLKLYKPHVGTHDKRAIGPVMVMAAKLGIITQSGRLEPNRNRHGSKSTLWRSLVYVGKVL